jgi:hypothetical protein
MVMRLALDNQIIGDLALGQERIGRYILSFQIDGRKQRNG